MSENYWIVDSAVEDNSSTVDEMKKNVKENTLSVNPNLGQYLTNTALTTARAVPRAGSYLLDIPNLIGEGIAYGKYKTGLLDQSKYGDAGYQGFGTAIPSLLEQDNANPLLNVFQPFGANLRESNPLSLFDDKDKISGAGYGILPSEPTVTFATDFAVFDKFGLNKIPKWAGGSSAFKNPFGGMQSAQAIRSAIIGGGAYNLGMFDSMAGISATIVADVISRKVTSKVGGNNTKEYLERVLGPEGLNQIKYSQWSPLIENVKQLDDIWINWTGSKRSVADLLDDSRVNNIVGSLQGSEAGQRILAEFFVQRGLQFDKTIQERFKPYLDMVKDNSGRILGKNAVDNMVKHYDGVNAKWREIIGKDNLNAKVSDQMKLDMNLILKESERLKKSGTTPSNLSFLETEVIPSFFNVEKRVLRDKNGKIRYDANRNKMYETIYTPKEFTSVNDFITLRNNLNAKLQSVDSKSKAMYGKDAENVIKIIDEQIIGKNVNRYGEAQTYKADQVKTFNQMNELTVDVFGSWEQLGKTGNSSNLAGTQFMDKTLKFMASNPSPNTIQAFIKMLKNTGNGAVLEQLMPYYISKKLTNVIKDGKKAEFNQVKIYEALVQTSDDYKNLNNWFEQINKNLNPNQKITHSSFKKSLDEFKIISDEMFRPIKNSNTFEKIKFQETMSKSSSANLLSILKLDFALGTVGSLKEWAFNTNTKMLAELIKSPDGVALLNALGKASNKEQKLRIMETIYKNYSVAYADTFPDRKAETIKRERIDQVENEQLEAERQRNEMIEYWSSQ
tara:strand:+ start:1571 stop:3931 length:2361 start_codon:yes stop_codon:yes gene_type:complete